MDGQKRNRQKYRRLIQEVEEKDNQNSGNRNESLHESKINALK
jgi:hypothetical protein